MCLTIYYSYIKHLFDEECDKRVLDMLKMLNTC